MDRAVHAAARADLDRDTRRVGRQRKMAAEHLEPERAALELPVEEILDLRLARRVGRHGVTGNQRMERADGQAAAAHRQRLLQIGRVAGEVERRRHAAAHEHPEADRPPEPAGDVDVGVHQPR